MAHKYDLSNFFNWLVTTPELCECGEARLSLLDTISGMI